MNTAYFLIGKTLGKYQIVRHLGHGGMAEVFLGEQIHLNRQVAIKILHPFLAEESGFVNRFQREARIVATLRHPNIVQVYDFDLNEEFGVYYMVMEYIEGPTLRERLEKGGIARQEGVRIAAAIADALEYAHRRQMVHRDIKPANILFTGENQPVLTDFGIARMLSLTGLTASGAMVGTPAYMAPEIGIGHPGTALSDIYSLGVVLYQLITGQLPFDAEVPMALVMKHINEPVPAPSRLVTNLPPELETIILKMLMKQPEKRFLTAGEVASALRNVMGWETPPAALVNTTTTARMMTPAAEPAQEAPSPPAAEEPEQPLLRRVTPQSATPPDGAETKAARRHARPLTRVLRWALALVAVIALGLAGWSAASGQLPPWVQQLLPERQSAASTPQAPSLTEATITPTPRRQSVATWTPTPVGGFAPTGTVTCAYRAEVLRAELIPKAAALPPQSVVRADITLRNGELCAWPEETRLALTAGESFGGDNSIALQALAAGAQIQLQLYFRAPETPGEYRSVWEVQLPDGRSISSAITFPITVGDLPTFTPAPTTSMTETPVPTEQLAVLTPILREWTETLPAQMWQGTLSLAAEGGSGNYRFYRDMIRADTEIQDATLRFEWRHCTDFPLTLIVVSGEEIERWQGSIPYPAPERCQP